MFTGLIREIGRIEGVRRDGGITRLRVQAPGSVDRLGPGDSLAVDGICLTVTALRGATVSLDSVAETRRVTTLGDWRPGRRVHLEPALRAGDPLGGHLVLGHVDGIGEVRRTLRRGSDLLLTIDAPVPVRRWLLPKGSVAVDGVSLTLDEGPFDKGFTVSLIPHTLAGTLFEGMAPGRRLNLEADVLAKGAEARAAAAAGDDGHGRERPGLTMDDILARGFGRAGRRRS